MLPSSVSLLHYRAKHQKLKTGNDQSPGDKKPETEADQRMFDQVLMCSVIWIHYVVCLHLDSCRTLSAVRSFCFSLFLLFFSCLTVASLLNNLFSVVPNGPAESDSEPANQMSWKEGRQLLRK